MEQTVDIKCKLVSIKVKPDERYTPVCHNCKRHSHNIHSYHERTVRDMSIFEAKTLIQYSYRKIRCPYCGIVVEDLGLVDPAVRVTKRLATYILDLCKFMTIKEIAEHLSLDWKTIKEIHKSYLKDRFSQKDIGYPRILAVDEISS